MIGAIAGDIIGSVHEHHPIKIEDFRLFGNGNRFTDDTVLTIAVAAAILDGRDYGDAIADFAERYPKAGYGGSFSNWVQAWDRKPYGSYGNGSAMRVSPVGWAFASVDQVLREAKRSAEVTHNHPEGIKGAQATALSIHLARHGKSKAAIKKEITTRFGYDLDRTLAQIRPTYTFDVTCQGSVPEAITAFLESDSYEDAVRKAISLGGDSDTQACIAGAIAEAFYGGVPVEIEEQVLPMLPFDLRTVADSFRRKFPGGNYRQLLKRSI
jgi:ADP-ribosylglycohydrolase